MVLAHALGYLVAALLQAAAALGLVAALTRVLSDAEFGQYGLAAAALHLYQSILFFWLRANVSRFHSAAEQENRLEPFLAAIRRWFIVAAALGLAVGGLAILLAPGSWGLRVTLWVTLIAGSTQGAFTLVLELHRARLRAWRYSLFQSMQAALSVALALALVALGGGMAGGIYGAALAVGGIALSYVLCILADAAGVRFWMGQGKSTRGGSTGGAPSKGEIAIIFAYGLPMTVAMVLDAILVTGDRFIIAHFLGEAGVAPYAAAQTLAHRSLMAICTVVGAAAAPLAFAALERGGGDEARAQLREAGDLLYAIAVPAAFGIAAVAGPLSEVMIGETLRPQARDLLPWIAAGALLQGLAVHYYQQAYLLARKPGALLAATAPAMVVYIAANITLVQRYGALGAAIALVVTECVQLAVVIIRGRLYFKMPLCLGTALKAVIAGAVMYAALRLLHLPGGALGLVVQVAIGGAIYGAIAFALNIARCRDLAIAYLRRA